MTEHIDIDDFMGFIAKRIKENPLPPPCRTWGELLGDFLWQLEQGQHGQLATRLKDCIEAYGHAELPPDPEEQDHG